MDQAIKDHELQLIKDLPPDENDVGVASVASSRPAKQKPVSDNSSTVVQSDSKLLQEKNMQPRNSGRPRRSVRAQSPTSVTVTPPSERDLNHRQARRKLKDKENVLQDAMETQGPESMTVLTGDMPIDPNEPRYCYCGQVSWGEVSALSTPYEVMLLISVDDCM